MFSFPMEYGMEMGCFSLKISENGAFCCVFVLI